MPVREGVELNRRARPCFRLGSSKPETTRLFSLLCYSKCSKLLPPYFAITGFVTHRNPSPEPVVWWVPGRVPGWLLTHVYVSRSPVLSMSTFTGRRHHSPPYATNPYLSGLAPDVSRSCVRGSACAALCLRQRAATKHAPDDEGPQRAKR